MSGSYLAATIKFHGLRQRLPGWLRFGGAVLLAAFGSACFEAEKAPVTRTHLVDVLQEEWIHEGGAPMLPDPDVVFRLSSETEIEGVVDTRSGDRVVLSTGQLTPATIQIPIKKRTRYRFKGRLEAISLSLEKNNVGASIELYELDRKGEVVMRHNHMQRVRRSGQEAAIDVVFETQPSTTSLQVMLGSGTLGTSGTVQFEDLELLKLPGIDRTLSMPRIEGHAMLRRVELGDDSRPALVVRAGTEILFDHGLQAPAVFRYSFARAPGVEGKHCLLVKQGELLLRDHCTGYSAWTDISVQLVNSEPLLLSSTGTAEAGIWGDPRVTTTLPDQRPNIVVITLDTLRADALSVYGSSRSSPNIDALAAQGVVFDRAHSVSGWTAPSLASMVTSTLPATHGAGSRIPREVAQTRDTVTQRRKNELNYRGMRQSELQTMAEVFREAGYETAGFYTNYFFSDSLGFARGFNRYTQFNGSGNSGGSSGVGSVKQWLAEHKGDEVPYFLSLHFVDPHQPYHLREKESPEFWPADPELDGVRLYKEQGIAVFDRFSSDYLSEIDQVLPFYKSEVSYVDGLVGEVLKALGSLDNTMVVVVADHGEAFGEHGKIVHGNSLFQELVRIPLIVRFPNQESAGTRESIPVSIIDIAPTVVGVAGIEKPKSWTGEDLRSPPSERRLIFEGAYSGPDLFAIMEWPYKLIWSPEERHVGFSKKNRPSMALYNLENNPDETVNLNRSLLQTNQRLVLALHDYLERAQGWHVRCNPEQEVMTVTLKSDGSLGQILALTLEPTDESRLSLDHQTLSLKLRRQSDKDKQDWLLLRSRRSDFVVESERVTVVDGPQYPAPGRCVSWKVELDSVDLGEGLSDDNLEALKVLGYLE